MIIGYVISAIDNKYSMYKGLQLNKCSRFMDIYSLNIINPSIQFNNIKPNFSYTYDGFAIVSEKFKIFCEKAGYSGIEFVELRGTQKYYWFKINNVLEFDPIERGTSFLDFNEECNGYEEIIGATPACLKNKNMLPDGFFRTDICFGSYAGKSPLYIIGEVTKKKLLSAGFDEIDFEDILEKYE